MKRLVQIFGMNGEVIANVAEYRYLRCRGVGRCFNLGGLPPAFSDEICHFVPVGDE